MPKQPRGRHPGRRAHRKSRNGCSECKNRHLKCDETRPECRNCVISELVCPYLAIPSTPSGPVAASTLTSVVGNHLLAVPRETQDGTRHSGPTFTATHMTFLHYAVTNMSDFMALQVRGQPVIDAALENAYKAPYLLDQVLALSALHLSTQNVAQASSFRRQATELQTRALGLFNEAKDHISEDTYVSTSLFVSLLGLYAITTKYWHRILHSDLQPLMHIPVISEQTDLEIPREDIKQLTEFLDSSLTSSTATEACLLALGRVQSDISAHAVMEWPLFIPDKYIEALYEYRPEALVVLAFYGAILYRYR
ncbi:Upc2 protein [Fusarium oxysporum f. sp. albedinis]|nr:Upc2 protein [Fusarium oxysporum f. sp. albedinis]